jgi:hypothetical protein
LLRAFKEDGKTKYKPVIGDAKDLWEKKIQK